MAHVATLALGALLVSIAASASVAAAEPIAPARTVMTHCPPVTAGVEINWSTFPPTVSPYFFLHPECVL
jgi:hypothetical protein